jgi:AcrR family transcriptional regulator
MSKMNLYNDAEKLFLYERLSPDEISAKLQVSRRTVYYWKNKFCWDKKLAEVLKNKQIFSNELQDFVKLLMQNIMKTIDKKEPTNQAMLYSLMNLLKQMPELQKYENKVQTERKPKEIEEEKQSKITEIVSDFLLLGIIE